MHMAKWKKKHESVKFTSQWDISHNNNTSITNEYCVSLAGSKPTHASPVH